MPAPRHRRVTLVILAGASVAVIALGLLMLTLLQLPEAVVAAPPGPGGPAVTRAEFTRVDFFPGSEARYRSVEVLAGRGVNEAIGKTPEISGALLFDTGGTVLSEHSRVSADLRNLQSDNPMRDRYIQRMTLQTADYPTAEFVLTAAPGLPLPLPTTGTADFTLVGDLTLHGVTRPTTWQVTASFSENQLTGSATTTVLLTEFGMEPPKAGPVVSIEDAVRIEIDVRGTIAPSLADLVSDPT